MGCAFEKCTDLVSGLVIKPSMIVSDIIEVVYLDKDIVHQETGKRLVPNFGISSDFQLL